MKKQISLQKNKGKRSVNVENGLMVPISTDERILPFDDISDVVNIKEIYDKEKDESDLYRLIFTINPVCSNVLFNAFTEIVYKEGSQECKMLTSDTALSNSEYVNRPCNSTSATQPQAIRDTEYSHSKICDGLVYHCGIDMFNNHILRSNGFVAVSKTKNGQQDRYFNTIQDYNRDKDGNVVQMEVNSNKKIDLHLYNANNSLTFKDTVRSRLVEDDGWFGFTNTSLIDIPNVKVGDSEMITVNKVLNNNKACEFIDMFPDRSLYSFIPKVNKYKNRLEKNWDYCLTYPYRNDYTMFQKVNQIKEDSNFCGIRVVNIRQGANENGINSFLFETMLNHNLSVGDYVRFYYTNSYTRCDVKTKVTGIGNATNGSKKRIFSVSVNTLDKKFINELTNIERDENEEIILPIFIKKETNQGECDYYFRIFRKIPNFASSAKNIYDMNNDIEEVIAECKRNYFKNECSKLSFAQNIYGDKSTQITFTDTIDLTRLIDNNGRKLSEIYLTIIKRNQGYEQWYTQNVYKKDMIEFSRAFGKVTSGLNLGLNNKCYDYNVRRLHNIEPDVINNNPILNIPRQSQPIEGKEKGLNINGWSESEGAVEGLFYGDIVERNPETCNEIVLEEVYHRFNTAQRETSNKIYAKISYDVMLQDDNLDDFEYSGFDKDFKMETRNYGETDGVVNANIAPEGYFYKPHFRIKVNEMSTSVTEENTTLINFAKSGVTVASGASGATITVTSPKDYDFKKSDVFLLYEKDNFQKNHHWGILENIKSITTISIRFETILKVDGIKAGMQNGKYILVKTNTNIPPHALPSQNLPHVFRWRDVVKPSMVPSDSDIIARPFTNGTHYIHSNVNFYLRRQDPFGDYRLQYGVRDNEEYNPLIDLTPYGDYKDITAHEYYSDDNYNSCII